MKASELVGPALDWAVAKCENVEDQGEGFIWFDEYDRQVPYSPSTNWSQGGPIIEREKITLDYDFDGQGLSLWTARKYAFDGTLLWAEFGDTPLIAAMRCYVASKLGDDVEIPEELK